MTKRLRPPSWTRQLLCLVLVLAPIGVALGQRALGERQGLSMGLGTPLVFEAAGKRLAVSPTGVPLLPQHGAPALRWPEPGWRSGDALRPGVPEPKTARFMLIRFGSWQLEGG